MKFWAAISFTVGTWPAGRAVASAAAGTVAATNPSPAMAMVALRRPRSGRLIGSSPPGQRGRHDRGVQWLHSLPLGRSARAGRCLEKGLKIPGSGNDYPFINRNPDSEPAGPLVSAARRAPPASAPAQWRVARASQLAGAETGATK